MLSVKSKRPFLGQNQISNETYNQISKVKADDQAKDRKQLAQLIL